MAMGAFKLTIGRWFAAAVVMVPLAAAASEPVAIVPNEVIYPGQAIDVALLREVAVTNPNVRADYVSSLEDLRDAVARRTLLPGRVIPISAVREAYAVERGAPVRLVFSNAGLTITASGSPLQSAAIGDFIKVRNTDTGVTVSGTVMADGSVQVVAQ
ncbi:flagellar basal body P-ring formation chaperone FlgA [Pararhizobium haloflavum]|uniref:flagellar basal body P-ring formation chaperone FlgA n=1 Tax=Pararhizobium haloflavum TaxID=2037914 RepID=UPI001FDED797|nr:flagellar basal body P-ring formation chaperone FlgA [Pararhizobium haloflavum]